MVRHAIVSSLTSAVSGLHRMVCGCGWTSGWRRTSALAHQSWRAHCYRMENMTVARAGQIAYDHALALHEDYRDVEGNCTWVGCAESRWVLMHTEEISQNNLPTRPDISA